MILVCWGVGFIVNILALQARVHGVGLLDIFELVRPGIASWCIGGFIGDFVSGFFTLVKYFFPPLF